MVLDPFTSLGLAGNIVQFVDFSRKLISESYQLYKSATGTLPENHELAMIAETLGELSSKLTSSSLSDVRPIQLSQHEKNLQMIGISCKSVAEELRATVEDLRVKGKYNKWQSFRQALRSVWKKDKIQALEKRLDSFRQELTVHLVAILR